MQQLTWLIHHVGWILSLIIILSILIVVHEWGHFIVARIFKIRVDEFSLGFGPRALRIGRLGATEYNIRWIPLGGFVKIAGMEPDEAPLLRAADRAKVVGRSTADRASEPPSGNDINATTLPLLGENTPNLNEPDLQARTEEDGFYSKPRWQRSLVIFGGPFMSFFLGYVVFCALSVSVPMLGPLGTGVQTVRVHSEAERMGLRSGDNIESINGVRITDGDQVVATIRHHESQKLVVMVRRAGAMVSLSGIPKPLIENGVDQGGALGFVPSHAIVKRDLASAISGGNQLTRFWFTQVGALLHRHKMSEIRKSAGGPIFIAQATQRAAEIGPPGYAELLAELSLSLAFFNLLPIPILDGGHLLIILIESVRRGKRLTTEQQQNMMLAGLAVIGVLFVMVMYNDILRFVHHEGP